MSDYEIFHQTAETTSLTYSGSELKVRETSKGSGYGVRILHDGKVGFSYCQRKSEIEEAKKQAEKISKFSPKTNVRITNLLTSLLLIHW